MNAAKHQMKSPCTNQTNNNNSAVWPAPGPGQLESSPISCCSLLLWNISASQASAGSHWRTALFIREEQRRDITHPPPALHKPPPLMFYKGLSAGELRRWRYWAVTLRRAGCRVPDRWFRGCEGSTSETCEWKCETRNTCNIRVQPKNRFKVPHWEDSPRRPGNQHFVVSQKTPVRLFTNQMLAPPLGSKDSECPTKDCFKQEAVNRGLNVLFTRFEERALVS